MSLELTILTLPFDPLLEGFSNERVRDFLHGRELVAAESFGFVHAGRPFWSVSLQHRRRRGAPVEAQSDPSASPKKPSSGEAKAAVRALLGELDEHQRALYDRLVTWRSVTAKAAGQASFMIAHNHVLLTLARRRPRTLAALAEVKGLGEKKIAAHGAAILEVLHGPRAERGAAPPGRTADDGPDRVAAGADPGHAAVSSDPRWIRVGRGSRVGPQRALSPGGYSS